MMWENLKVYEPLPKSELVIVKKEIIKIIAERLDPFGFKLYGRKLIKLSDDIVYIIHLDTRGSWSGVSCSLKTEISIVSIFDKEILVKGYEHFQKKYIQDIISNLRNYYQITAEYVLFADYISRKLIEYIIPYFNRYKDSKEIINCSDKFILDNQNLLLYSELVNHENNYSKGIITKKVNFMKGLKSNDMDELFESTKLKKEIEESNWDEIDKMLNNNKIEVLKKLKINMVN